MGIDIAVAGSAPGGGSGVSHGETIVLETISGVKLTDSRTYSLPLYTEISGKYSGKFDDYLYYSS